MSLEKISFAQAAAEQAAGIAAVRLAAARDLTRRFGQGSWSFSVDSEQAVRGELVASRLLIATDETSVIGTLKLSTRNPYLADVSFFTPVQRPVWLTAMAVLPRVQRQGIGRRLLEGAEGAAAEMRGQAIRLDSYDAPAGAGEFYRKCGFREVHRGSYHGTPLIWFERLLD